MAAQQFGRQQLARPPQHALTGFRVDVVGDPDPFGALHHLEVDAGTTRGAGLELDTREAGPQLVEQAVEGTGLRSHGRPAAGGCSGVGQIPVVVPFDVVDGVFGQDRAHLPEDVIVGAGDRQVEHLLVPGADREPSAGLHDPLWVGPGEIGILVHHLGLEPQPELHPEPANPVDQRVKPVRPDLGAHHPVTQPGAVVAAGAEPAVVQHVAFDAQGGGPLGEVDQPGGVVVEVDRLPDVDRHRTIRAWVHRQRAEVVVEAGGLRVQPHGVVEVDPGGPVALALGERPFPG